MNNLTEERPREVLMVEDNAGDVRMVVEAWKDDRVKTHLTVLRNAGEALAFLRCEGQYRVAPRPDLVLVDLNLARIGGQDLLAVMKRDPKLRRLPVVVLTTSDAQRDVLQCYDSHANCYVVKPCGHERSFEVLRSIRDFWLTVATLPPSS
jgi:CheY-like chemotaxis protein